MQIFDKLICHAALPNSATDVIMNMYLFIDIIGVFFQRLKLQL